MAKKNIDQHIRIVIIEDNEDFAESLRLVLAELWQITQVYHSVSVEAAVNELAGQVATCDCILLDINLPGISGVEGLEILKQLCLPDCAIIMLTLAEDRDTIKAAMQQGAAGYLLKTDPIVKLLQQVLNAVQNDFPALSKPVYHQLTQIAGTAKKPLAPDAELTTREREIYQGVIKGYDYKSVAAELHITTATVNFHLQNIFLKLGVRTKAELLSRHLKMTQ